MIKDLTKGSETKAMIAFAVPMIIGNLFQQLYNVVDTIVVGQFIGADALAAVGFSYTLMVFLTSILLGLCMGSGVVFSHFFGAKQIEEMKTSFAHAFLLIGILAVLLNAAALLFLNDLLWLLQVPENLSGMTRDYLQVIFYGILFTFFYNFFAAVLRSMGNSVTPLLFLIVSALLNVGLDLLFVLTFHMGVAGAAWATVISQAVSAVGIVWYCFRKMPEIRPSRRHFRFNRTIAGRLLGQSTLTSVQQSIMNFGILLVQGLVNSFGVSVMAAFAAAVKIDSFAYMPVQDFGNAFSTYIAQNQGAGKTERIRKGIRSAFLIVTFSCLVISAAVIVLARPLMLIFVQEQEREVIALGVQYLRIVAAFYCLIGYLFLFYGFYRGLGRAQMSIVLTVISLGTRVALAYWLSSLPIIGLTGIWWAIPIGWFLADAVGALYYLVTRKKENKISIER